MGRHTTPAAALLAALVLAPVTAPAAERAWFEVRSPNFTVVGDAPEPDLREIAVELECMREIFQANPGMGDSDPPVPVVVMVLRDEAGMREIAPPALIVRGKGSLPAGYFHASPLQVQIAMRLDTRADATRISYHEYHHLLLDRGSPNAPVWLREGLAQLWASVRIDGRTIDVGNPDELLRPVLMVKLQEPLPIETLLEVDHDSKHYKEPTHQGRFYAQSFLFTHMLLFGEPDGERRLASFIDALGNGVPARTAMERIWGELDELDERFENYLSRTEFTHRLSTLAREPGAETTLTIRRLTPTEALGYRGQFLAYASPLTRARAEEALLRAVVDDPDDVRALTALAAISPKELSETLLERVTPQPDAPFDAHWLAARNDKMRLRTTNGRSWWTYGTAHLDSAGRAQLEHHLERTLALAPRFAPAYVHMANLLQERDPARALGLLGDAARLERDELTHLLRIARLTADRRKAREIAVAAAQRAVAMPRARAAHDVCYYGALAGFAREVLPACDEAVDRWEFFSRTTRGVARAIAGDRAGAIEDLRSHADAQRKRYGGKTPRFREDEWADALANGGDPFDEKFRERALEANDNALGMERLP